MAEQDAPPAPPPPNAGKVSLTNWDPTGFEEAARLAKSCRASEFVSLKASEEKKQKEATKAVDAHHTQNKAIKSQMRSQVQQVKQQLKKEEQQENQQRAQYRAGLQKETKAAKLQHEQALKQQVAEFKRQAALKAEQAARETAEFEVSLGSDRDKAEVAARSVGEVRTFRENFKLHLERMRIEAAEQRKTVLESVELGLGQFGAGAKDFLSDTERMSATVGVLAACALGIYGARTATGVAGRFIESRIGKPSLVRESSRVTLSQAFRAPVATASQIATRRKGGTDPEQALAGVVLAPALDARLRLLAHSTTNTKRHGAPFRHVLLHGPPGTGKTLFAKKLAEASGLHYAIMTGGDVAPLGRDAVTEMHKLFEWSSATSGGVLLFVDEADAFLRRRATELLSEDLRNSLNAFLYRTGETQDKIMVVFASNQPEQFDWAVNDRIDEMVEFTLPAHAERTRLLDLYFERYITNPANSVANGGTAKKIVVDETLTPAHMATAVDATEGFSGREISKLAIAWQAAAYGTPDARFTPELMADVLESYVEQRAIMKAWELQASGGGTPPPVAAV